LEGNIRSQDKRIFPVLSSQSGGIMNRIIAVLMRAATTVLLVLAVTAGWAHDRREPLHFTGTLQATGKAEVPPQGRCKGPTLTAVGAGDTNLFGSVYIEQSHCVRPDGTFFDGVFKLTKTPPPIPPYAKPLIEGRYCGTLVPTFNSTFLTATPTTPATPQGTWLIAGSVCITKTILGQVDGDCRHPTSCSPPPRGYEPARGITNLTNGLDGPATIFIDQWIRFK
jgi:hypothetical protein